MKVAQPDNQKRGILPAGFKFEVLNVCGGLPGSEVIEKSVLCQELSGCIELPNSCADLVAIFRFWTGFDLALTHITE